MEAYPSFFPSVMGTVSVSYMFELSIKFHKWTHFLVGIQLAFSER